jgi:predicted metal-dependent hydrolase
LKDFTFTVARSNRKTLSIYVERNGSVLVRAPRNIPQKVLNAIIKIKGYWIYKSITELQELNRTKVTREIANGEGFLFMGKSYRLKIEEGLETPLTLAQGFFKLDADDVEDARQHFINFYKEKGKQHISERVHLIRGKFGVNPKSIRVMDLQNRWASRSDKSINFHWKVMLAPMTIIDYVIIHELAHYLAPGHGSKFWEQVESVMPDYQEKKIWLRNNGANLDI